MEIWYWLAVLIHTDEKIPAEDNFLVNNELAANELAKLSIIDH